MKQEEEKSVGLPDNAFRPLKPGEQYHPIMSPNKKYPEVNLWSVLWGIAMAVLFSAAAAYLGLKVGQVFEAAIPIAIIAVGVSGAAKRKNALGENVIIQSIGACSGVIVAGAIFTLPALYILQDKYPEMTVNFFQMFVSSLLGGILGILFLIPFRKYFVSDKHGEYPFPEATASTQVLVSGEKGGSQAKPLLFAGLIGGLYDFIVATFGWWNENFTTRVCGWGEMVAEKAKLVMKINTGAAVLGLGYIVGLKYAAIICAGSLVVWLVIVPGMALLFGDQVLNAWNPALTQTISEMSPEVIFKEYAKSIGIGGIAMAGVIGIVRSWGIIKSAVGLAAKEMGGKKVEANVIRTQKDLSMKIIAFGSIFTILLILLFFFFDVMHGNVLHSIVAIWCYGLDKNIGLACLYSWSKVMEAFLAGYPAVKCFGTVFYCAVFVDIFCFIKRHCCTGNFSFTRQICLCDVEVNYLIDKLCFGCFPFFYCACCLSRNLVIDKSYVAVTGCFFNAVGYASWDVCDRCGLTVSQAELAISNLNSCSCSILTLVFFGLILSVCII